MTPERLREIYGDPSPRAAAKIITKFDKHCRQFIEHATFLMLASSDGSILDVSPRGDPAGFVTVETDTTLLLPDRPGNNRIDGLMNILLHPKVALCFMIPSVGETLRVKGSAEICEDQALRDQFQIRGRSPKTVLRITAEEIFMHCGKASMRAGLWRTETWPTARPIPSQNEMIRDHGGVQVDSIEQSAVEDRYRQTLY